MPVMICAAPSGSCSSVEAISMHREPACGPWCCRQERAWHIVFRKRSSLQHFEEKPLFASFHLTTDLCRVCSYVHPFARKSFTAGRMSLLMPRLPRYSASGAQQPPTEPVNGRQSACAKPWQLKPVALCKPRTFPPRLFSSNSSSKVPALPLPRHTRAEATETPIATVPRLALDSLSHGRKVAFSQDAIFEALRLVGSKVFGCALRTHHCNWSSSPE